MLLIINVIFWLLVAIAVLRTVKVFIARPRCIGKIRRSCERMRYQFRCIRSPFASFFRTSEDPDIYIKTPKKDYYVRIVSSWSRRHFYFAGPYYCTHMKKAPILMVGSKRAMRVGTASQDYMNLDEKFRIYPKPKLPKNAGTEVGYILLFNPAPAEIHVAEGRRSEVVDSGGKIGEFTIYDGKQFCNMLEYGEVKRTFRFGE